MELTRWTAKTVAEIREDLGELRGKVTADIGELRYRMAAVERNGKRKGRSIWARLTWLAHIPWSLVIGTILLLTGHLTLPELKAWVSGPPGH
jgi:hypothetical protein